MPPPEDNHKPAGKKSQSLTDYLHQLRSLLSKSDVAAGLTTGTVISGLFNPWDRGLYLSMKYCRPFLSRENFTAPYQGYAQAMVQRTLFGGLYYVLQSKMKTYLYPSLCDMGISENGAHFAIGLGVGTLNGVLSNPMSAIKYHTWGHDDRSFKKSLIEMQMAGGLKPFWRGTLATVYREIAFACPYEVVRTSLKRYLLTKNTNVESAKYITLGSNMFAAGLSTVLSSPYNYVRNMQYSEPPDHKERSTMEILRELREAGSKIPNASARARFFQNQLRLGWGTARVAVGMAAGQALFDFLKTPSNT
jgi:hypothetical protein